MRARSRTRVDDNGYLANPLGVVGLTQAGRGRLIAQQATSAYHARDGGGQEIVNRNDGSADPAVVGSTTGIDLNDPTFLDHDGTDYVWLPGTADNYASLPDSAALDITGDIDIRAKVALVDWTPTANNYILSKYSAVDGNRSFFFRINASNGYPTVGWSDDGTGAGIRTIAATAAPTVSDGDSIHLRVTVDVDNDATGTDVNFYTSSNGSSWTQLGTTVTTAGTHAIYAGTADVLTGCLYNGVQHLDGIIHSVEVRDGIDGSIVATFNPSDLTGWTVNRSSTGLKTAVVTRPVYLFDGTDDYIQLPASDTPTFTATSGKHTVVVAFGALDAPPSLARLYASNTDATGQRGLQLCLDTNGTIKVRIGVVGALVSLNTTTTGFPSGVRVAAVVCDDGNVAAYDNAEGLTSTSSYSALSGFALGTPRVGSRTDTVAGIHEGEVFAALSFPGVALTETELGDLSAYLLAGAPA
jgi:hypothetical protein